MSVKLIFSISLCICAMSQQVISAKFNTNLFERKMLGLMKVLNYMMERPQQMNMDTTFGVTFAEAHLKSALQHKNVLLLDDYHKVLLTKLLEESETTRKLLQAYEKAPNRKMQELSYHLSRPEIWIKPIIWRKLDLATKPSPDVNLSVSDIMDSMYKGHPKENEGDACFSDLTSECRLTKKCLDIIAHNDNSTTGYPLTHRLLMVQLMNAVQCETKITPFSQYYIHKFCSLMLQDLVNIEYVDFPHFSQDLALEQILLCGMEGYLDFLDDHYQQLLLDWQHPSGCYRGRGIPKFVNWAEMRARRAATYTDFDCVNHATGLGAAVLALFIRKDIEFIV